MQNVLRKAVVLTAIVSGIATAAGVMAQGRGGRAGSAAAAPPAPAPAQAAKSPFPEGESKKIIEGACAGCHDLDLVITAKHDEKAWAESLSHMVTYGASITDAQIPTLAAYLAKAFPVEGAKKADAAPKEDPDVVGERILNKGCTTCHDLGPITRRADDKASWEGIVYGMVGNGADVKDAEIPILVDYLVKFYGPPKPATTPAAPPARGGAPQRGAPPAGR